MNKFLNYNFNIFTISDIEKIQKQYIKIDYYIECAAPDYDSLKTDLFKNFDRLWNNYLVADKILSIQKSAKIILLSSVSTYGQISHLTDIYLQSINPNLYGIAKSFQEKIYSNKFYDRLLILRLPAVLTKGSVVHLPSRILNSMKQNREIVVSNPDRLWNACLLIDDLFKLIIYTMKRSFRHQIIVPHCEGKIPIIELFYTMKKLLSSKSPIIINHQNFNENVSFIDFDLDLNGFKCLDIQNTLTEYINYEC